MIYIWHKDYPDFEHRMQAIGYYIRTFAFWKAVDSLTLGPK